MMKRMFVFLIIMLFGICLVGCNKGDYTFRGGFDDDLGCVPAPNIWCGFTTDKSRFKGGEDLNVKLYFGTLYSKEDFLNRFKRDDILPNDVLTEMWIERGSCSKRLNQIGENTYRYPTYTFEDNIKEKKLYKEIEDFTEDNYPLAGTNSKFEEIVVPSEWFTYEMGVIVWFVRIYGVWSDGVDRANSIGAGVELYYRIVGKKVILYASYYDFANDIRK